MPAHAGAARHPFWLRTPRGDRACWLHLPPARARRAAGVVVCPPIGHEYTHSYRSLRCLADRLADVGIAALRLDYHGCGSSPGTTLDDDLLATWVDDVRGAAAFVARMTERPASVVGLRLGAALGLLASSHDELDHVVAWAPVASGRRWVREQRTLSAVRGNGSSTGPVLEAGGAALSDAAARELSAVDVAASPCRIRGQALVVERDDLPGPHELSRRLADQGVVTESVTASGYVAMMDKPHASVVPSEALDTIVSWLDARTRDRPARPVPPIALPTTGSARAPIVEELLEIPRDPPLFGVLTAPRDPTFRTRPTLVMPNAGSAHSAGPNRTYVELARALAGAGFASLRVDLRNLGDSAREDTDEENHPYPSTAAEDIRGALEWLSRARGVERVILGGLCSAAYHAFVYGHEEALADRRHGPRLDGREEARVEGLLLVNPLTFRWRAGDTLATPDEARYHASLRDPRKWRKLRGGAYDAGDIARFVAGAVTARAARFAGRAMERIGLGAGSRLGHQLEAIAASGCRIDFLFARYDPGHDLLMASARGSVARLRRSGDLTLATIDGGDHSFTSMQARAALVGHVIGCLRRYGLERTGTSPLFDPSTRISHVANA